MTKARNIAEFADDLSVSNGEVSIADLKPSQSMMFRNKIINGNFDIWQRGTSLSVQGFCADRWFVVPFNSTQVTSQQLFTNGQTEVPGNPKFYHRMIVTSVAGSGNYVLVQQRIEGVETLAGKTATLSFWAKADANKNIATEFQQYFGSGGSPSTGVVEIGVTTHSLTASWQKFTTTVSIPSISGKTIGTDGNDFLTIYFWFDAGSDINSRTNSLGQQSGTFDIAQVQLEESTVATPFEHRPYGLELSLCQRYFEKSYNIEVTPGTNTYTGIHTNGGYYNLPAGNYGTRPHTSYKVTKRGSTTVKTYDSAGNLGKCNYPDTVTNQSFTIIHSGQSGFSAETSTLSGGTDGRCYWQWTVESEL